MRLAGNKEQKNGETLEAVTSRCPPTPGKSFCILGVVVGACNLLKANKFLMLTNVENVSRNLPGKTIRDRGINFRIFTSASRLYASFQTLFLGL